MNEYNFSRNTRLIDKEDISEVIDLDTMYGNETEINTTRMRLPTRYDISKLYKRDYSKPSSYDTEGKPRYEQGEWIKKEADQLPVFTDADFDWQITYKFPSTRHKSKTPSGKRYGGEHVTYRRLYLILCEHFNGGEFFIDEYFNSVYPDSWVKEEVDVELHNLQDELTFYASDLMEGAKVTKRGTLDRRKKDYVEYEQKLNEWQDYAREWEEKKGVQLAKLIAEDIKRALENGEIPLQLTLSEATKKKRIQAGVLTADTVFFAMGDLIDHIQLFIKLGGNGKWRTEQGILV